MQPVTPYLICRPRLTLGTRHSRYKYLAFGTEAVLLSLGGALVKAVPPISTLTSSPAFTFAFAFAFAFAGGHVQFVQHDFESALLLELKEQGLIFFPHPTGSVTSHLNIWQ